VVEVSDDGSGRGPRIGCSIKLVNQADGTDLDPGGSRYRPRGGGAGGGGGGRGGGPVGADAGAVVKGGAIDWGHLRDGKEYGRGGYEMLGDDPAAAPAAAHPAGAHAAGAPPGPPQGAAYGGAAGESRGAGPRGAPAGSGFGAVGARTRPPAVASTSLLLLLCRGLLPLRPPPTPALAPSPHLPPGGFPGGGPPLAPAGRGRGATLPAWMTGGAGVGGGPPAPGSGGLPGPPGAAK
jgi:hypothetical protein